MNFLANEGHAFARQHRWDRNSVNITDMLTFAILVGAGYWVRANSSAHKRLMSLATALYFDPPWKAIAIKMIGC